MRWLIPLVMLATLGCDDGMVGADTGPGQVAEDIFVLPDAGADAGRR